MPGPGVRAGEQGVGAVARRVPADRASGCSNGTAAATPSGPITAAAAATARSAPMMAAREASSSATSSAIWRGVAPSSEKLKSTTQGRPVPSATMLAGRSERCAIRARCSLSTCSHSLRSIVSLRRCTGIRSRELPSNAVHRQQRRPIGGLDHLADGGHRHPGPLRHDRGERLVLDRLDERGGGPGIADVAQPDEPVRAVQQVGVPLIGAEDLDKQRLPVLGGRDERPRALRLDPGRLDAGHRQARRAQRRRDPLAGRCAGQAPRTRRAHRPRPPPRRRTPPPLPPARPCR